MDKSEAFAAELSELCAKHGIGIAGDPELFVYDWEDRAINYVVNADSKLVMR